MVNLTPKRRDLLANIGDVSYMDGRDPERYALGRLWKVTADVRWLLNAELIEHDPDTDDLDFKGYRRTAAGDTALNDDKETTR